MVVIKKILNFIKLLNSENTPTKLAWGISFGLLIGLMGWLPQTLFILFFILFLRINLSSVIVNAGIFKGISYFIYPFSHILGKFLLTLPLLKPLWESLYNIPFMKFTKFNNTVVLGNTFLGIILFFPIFFLSKKLIEIYKNKILEWIDKRENIKKFFEMIEGENEEGFIRWKGILVFCIILVLLSGIYYIRFDKIIKYIIIKTGEKFNAKVTIKDLHFYITKGDMELNEIKVIKKKSKIESYKIKLNVEVKPLLYGCSVINTIGIEGLNLEKANFKEMIKKTSKEEKQNMNNKKKENFIVKLLEKKIEKERKIWHKGLESLYNIKKLTYKDIEKLLENLDLETPKVVKEINEKLQQRYKKYQNYLNNLPKENEIERLKKDIENIKKDIKSFNNPTKILTLIEKFKKYRESLLKYRQRFKYIIKELKNNIDSFQYYSQKLDKAIQHDLNKIKDISYSIKNLENLGKALVGDEFFKRIKIIIKILSRLYNTLNEIEIEKEEKEIEEERDIYGENIHFILNKPYPRLWIKKIYFKTKNKIKNMDGEILNITTQPKKVKDKFLQVKLELKNYIKELDKVKVYFKWSYLDKILFYKITGNININSKSPKNYKNIYITKGKLKIILNGTFEKSSFKLLSKLYLKNTNIIYKSSNKFFNNIINSALKRINKIWLKTKIIIKKDKIKIYFKNNLDKVLYKNITNIVEENIKNIKKKLKEKLTLKLSNNKLEVINSFKNIKNLYNLSLTRDNKIKNILNLNGNIIKELKNRLKNINPIKKLPIKKIPILDKIKKKKKIPFINDLFGDD